MTFQNNKYQVIKNALPCELADFIFNYFLIKKNAVNFLYQNKLYSPNVILGDWEDPQIPNTYSCYGDFAMETLMVKMLPVMKKQTGLNLIPTYSYARVYKKGDELKKHKDRPSCEISTTLNLGGDHWSIYLEGIKVDLQQGDMLIYSGCELEHWREPFEGNFCVQVFLHYNHANGKFGQKNLFDKRPILGIPKA